MFKRKIYDRLLEWKRDSSGKTAILIEGARRIGKSTVAEEFAKAEYKSYIMIDFATASQDTIALFNDMSDLNYFFLRLQLQYGKELHERKSLIIFDEVQLCPKARQAIKALVKDGRYDYIETGSLISIKRNVKDILIPSEEKKLEMYPMDFEEFLWAYGDNATVPLLRQCYDTLKPLGSAAAQNMLRKYRLYMLVGGMPQAVSEYLTSNSFKRIDEVKRDILTLYENDLMKLDGTGRISLIYSAIPAELAKNSSRYSVSGVLKNERPDTMLEELSELQASKTVLLSYHANDPSAGLANNLDLRKFKLFMNDTGLFVTQMFKDKAFTENVIYEKLLSGKLPANLGYLYENAVAQTLAANGHRLYYHTIKNDISKHSYETDFLLQQKDKISPAEVKSSGIRKHKSLDVFAEKYSGRIYKKYLISPKDLQKDKDIICLPVYMTMFL